MLLMLLVVACYTVCSLSDKIAISKYKFNGNQFTFLMAFASAFFILFTLPFVDRHFEISLNSLFFVVLVVISKLLEFQMSAIILKEMSAFELKAWLGLCLFFSYASDCILYGTSFNVFCIVFIAVTVLGLYMIAKSGNGKINYLKILIPLALYLSAKFGYGLIIKASTPYISSTMVLFFALIILSIVLFPLVKPIKLIRESKKGTAFVALTKIPNVIGLITENAVIAISLTNYSFIQPMILCALFFIGLIQKEKCSRLNIIGSIICIVGVVGFQVVQII